MYLGKKHHTTEEANKSRLITKVRLVVESANGCIKQWRFPYKVVPDNLVKYIGDFVKIVCAILNCFRPQTLSIDTASNEIANVITPYIRMLDSDWLIAVMFFSKKSGLAL